MLARRKERALLDDVLERISAGHSSTLVIEGEAGGGKSTLLGYLIGRAAGTQLLAVSGIQSEVELSYAALHQLCRPLLSRLAMLPEPQRQALEITFGMRIGPFPNKFLIGLAVLTLISEASDVAPVLCAIDDAQWLDQGSADVLGFVARRLDAEAVGMVFCRRTPSDVSALSGIPAVLLAGLDDADAGRLLAEATLGRLEPSSMARIVEEASGNPLALLETARALSRAEIETGRILSSMPSRPTSLEAHFQELLRELPAATQRLLLVAAAEPSASTRRIQSAATILGVSMDDAAPAIVAGLCHPGAGIHFHHPLVRSATYRMASRESLKAVHTALSRVEGADSDTLAWHRALGAEWPDEDAARGLAEVAERAIARGAPIAGAALLKQAQTLSAVDTQRSWWSLRIAQAELMGGQFDEAQEDLAESTVGATSATLSAEAKLTQGRLAFARQRGGVAIPLLLDAADQLVSLNPILAEDAYLDSFSAGLFAGGMLDGGGLEEVVRRWRGSGLRPEGSSADALRVALWNVVSVGEPASWRTLSRALASIRDVEPSERRAVPWLRVSFSAASAAWDLDAWDAVSLRLIEISRSAGDYSELPIALSSLALVQLFAGDLRAAAITVQEMATITSVTGEQVSPYGAIALAAVQGREADLHDLISATVPAAERRSEGTGLAIAYWGAALLNNSKGNFEAAFEWAARATPLFHPLHSTSAWALVELLEASSNLADAVDVDKHVERLTAVAMATGTDWAQGVLARTLALLSGPSAAEDYFQHALRLLEPGRTRLDFARTCLLYGEWLSHRKRDAEARAHLTRAREIFESMGATAFAERAASKLSAGGLPWRGSGPRVTDALTTQESHIARLAGEGLSNSEIATRMFLSPRTVEYHLAKVFTKLQISSRHQIAGVTGVGAVGS